MTTLLIPSHIYLLFFSTLPLTPSPPTIPPVNGHLPMLLPSNHVPCPYQVLFCISPLPSYPRTSRRHTRHDICQTWAHDRCFLGLHPDPLATGPCIGKRLGYCEGSFSCGANLWCSGENNVRRAVYEVEELRSECHNEHFGHRTHTIVWTIARGYKGQQINSREIVYTSAAR